MKNSENDGIVCDYCSAQLRLDFIYYSFDFNKVAVSGNNSRSSSNDCCLSCDICESCMEAYADRIKEAYKPPILNTYKCDISGEVISAGTTFVYYVCRVSKVIVTISKSQYCCMKCGKSRNPSDGPCCGAKLQRVADVQADREYLSINFSDTTYGKFKEHVELTKKSGVEQWTAQ